MDRIQLSALVAVIANAYGQLMTTVVTDTCDALLDGAQAIQDDLSQTDLIKIGMAANSIAENLGVIVGTVTPALNKGAQVFTDKMEDSETNVNSLMQGVMQTIKTDFEDFPNRIQETSGVAMEFASGLQDTFNRSVKSNTPRKGKKAASAKTVGGAFAHAAR